MPASPTIGIMGAGAVGCFLGGRLIASGHDVVLVGRLGAEIAEHGLTLTDYRGAHVTLDPERVTYRADASALCDRDIVLVTVKSMATEGAARSLRGIVDPKVMIVSFQNGVRNAAMLRFVLPFHRILSGMVPFNVLRTPGAHVHQGTSGPLALERGGGAETALAEALRRAGFGVDLHGSLDNVLWSKLLFNLNNSVNALAGVPLREELSRRAYRRVLALSIQEGLSCLRAAGIRPARAGRMIPWLTPHVLSLPDALFARAAGAMIKVDPSARSSMWEDLERRRHTEIDYLNGEILRLADAHRVSVPVNRTICDLVKSAEDAKQGSPRVGPEDLLARVRA